MKRLPLGNGKKFNRSVSHREWRKVYPQFAATLDARVEDDGQEVVLVFNVDTWEGANAILYATLPKRSVPPPHGE